MHFTILTLFPEMFASVFSYSIINRAVEKKLIQISYVNLRNFATDAYGSVDDHPFGGGHGMILRVDIADAALKHARSLHKEKSHAILMDPVGIQYSQKTARNLARENHIIILCGHYEGVDERVKSRVDSVISVGPYVVTGGEIPAMTIVDSVTRLVPGVLKGEHVTREESFSNDRFTYEYPQYTRPASYEGEDVPSVLLSGNHKEISNWRDTQAKEKSKSTD